MSSLEDLSPDQRAVVQLLLKQGKSYDELGRLLRIDAAAVRSRAASALGALGPALDDADRDELTDWLLGQQTEEQARETRDLLAGSPAALEWATEVSDALREGGLEPRVELPSPAPAPDDDAQPVAEPAADAPSDPPPAPLPGFGTDDEPSRPSRLGGILLLVGAAAVIAVLLVVFLGRGGDDDSPTTSAQTQPAATTSTTPTTGTVRVEAQVNMTPPGGATDGALGVAQLFTDGTNRGVTVTAQGLKRNGKGDTYALWLAGGADDASSLLGFSPSKVKANGRFSGSITLPENAADFSRIELTRETSERPSQPGDVVLRGSLK